MPPEKIIVIDQDGGFIVAEKDNSRTYENKDGIYVHVYKYKEYYHELETAIKDEF